MSAYEIMYISTSPLFAFSVFLMFRAFFDNSVRNKKNEFTSYAIYSIIMSTTIHITRIPLLLLGFNILILFLLSINYKSSFQKKIVFVSLICVILLVIEIGFSVATGYMSLLIYEDSTYNSAVGIILIRTLTLIVAYLIYKFNKYKKKNYVIPKLYCVLFSIILFGTLFLFINTLNGERITMNNILINGAVLILVNITMIFIDEKIFNAILIDNEKKILQQQNRWYENQAEIINQSTESINTIKHDMKNHLLMLNGLLAYKDSDEMQAYISRIMEELENGNLSQSGNFVIDSILNFKLSALKDAEISLDINVPQSLNILAYDLTIILGNLLDNAITAIEKAQVKKLDVRISCSKSNLIIFMDNSFNGEIIFENGVFKTTKAYKANHGIGLSNVEKALLNYGGELRTEYASNTFSTVVIIPF